MFCCILGGNPQVVASNRQSPISTHHTSRNAPATPATATTMADNTSSSRPPAKSPPTLSSALASSIRHHARIIDGRDAQQHQYDEERISTLSTSTERAFESEAKLAVETRQYEGIRDTDLLDFVSNPQDNGIFGRQQIDTQRTAKAGITAWFGGETQPEKKSVRFATDSNNYTSMMLESKLPKQWVRSNNFVVPPATSFRLATRHPSQGYYQPGVSRSNLQKQKRNDVLLRLIIAILCFGMSLTFVMFLSNGRWDAYMSSFVTSHTVNKDIEQDELDLYYPIWWKDEIDIPDMESRLVDLAGVTEFNVADITKERAPGRIETPFFWLIPKSGGNVIRAALESCERLVEASDLGAGFDQNVSSLFPFIRLTRFASSVNSPK